MTASHAQALAAQLERLTNASRIPPRIPLADSIFQVMLTSKLLAIIYRITHYARIYVHTNMQCCYTCCFFSASDDVCQKTFFNSHASLSTDILRSIRYWYRPNLLFGSLQNISAPVGLIEKLRPLYYIKQPIPLLMSHVLGLWEKLLLNKVEREKKITDQAKAFLSCIKTVKDNCKIFCSSYSQKM